MNMNLIFILIFSMETLKQSELKAVKFNSMVNLNVENDTTALVTPSSSCNSLEPYVGGLKKKNSIYKTIKGLINPRRVRHSDGNIEKHLPTQNIEVPDSDKQDDKFEINRFSDTDSKKELKENGSMEKEKSNKKEKPPKLRESISKLKIWKNHKVKVPVNC